MPPLQQIELLIEEIDERIRQLQVEINEYRSLKNRKLINTNEINIVMGAIIEELENLCKTNICLTNYRWRIRILERIKKRRDV